MDSESAPLKGKLVGVVGFNARPIACSAKKAGANVIVSDYWGDEDLSSCCDDWIAMLIPTPGSRQRQPLETSLPEGLVSNLQYLRRERDLDYIIIGSGFDDHVDTLEPLHKEGLLIGCSPNQMKKARDFTNLEKIGQSLNIKTPRRVIAETPDAAIRCSKEFDLPYIIRPTYSGGGSGIRFVRDSAYVIRAFGDPKEGDYEPRVVQEYVSGTDISCSVLATGNLALTLSVQGQLIGMPTAGRNCDFAYCGNYYPTGLTKELDSRIAEVSEAISTELGLVGSIGMDFVVDKSNQIWLMEINPRIQGTLELIETAGNISITNLHVLASQGLLPENLPKISPCVKMIVYSRRDGIVPDLTQYHSTVDRTPQGVMVNIRDPICTVIHVGSSMRDCYRTVSEVAKSIQERIS